MYHHRIPCYGDLAPGIPGVVDTKPAERLTSLLPERLYSPRSGEQEFSEKNDTSPDLLASYFACLRLNADSGELARVLAVARDFSPRVMTASAREVLVDISGLGRLIGPPDEIARQLAHAMFDAGLTANVGIGPTFPTLIPSGTTPPSLPVVREPGPPFSGSSGWPGAPPSASG